MTIEEAIKAMQNIDLVLSVTESEHEAARMAISALRAQAERENPQPSTNADRIRGMDDNELAEFLSTKLNDDFYEYPDLTLQWLQQPAEEEV